MIKAIFFDFDGVLVESVDIKTKAFGKLFESEGHDIAIRVMQYHLDNTGVSRYDKFKYIYKEILSRPLCKSEFNMLCERFAKLVVESVVNAPYVAGAREFLEDGLGRYFCAVTSATPQQEMEEIIRRRGMDRFFRTVYGAPTKKVDAVKDVLVTHNLDSGTAVYVGDAMSDYIAARDNGVAFIARINNNESIFADVSCPRINDLTDLHRLINSL